MKSSIKLLWMFVIAAISVSCVSEKQEAFDYQGTVDFCLEKLNATMVEVPEGQYPKRTKGVGEWELVPPSDWTSGFYPGCLWFGYKLTPDVKMLQHAITFTEGLEEQQYNTSTHDLGFMIFNSYGNAYEITDKREYKDVILQAAESLASRFDPDVGCTQSWDGEFQVIIDNMMNLELLFWASKNGGDERYYDMAISHANTTIKNHLREDGSSFHVVEYDSTTGEIIRKRTHQGYADSSCWARGQAWGIYGFTMTFRETQDSTYLHTAIKMADYFIDNLPEDYVPFWDFNLPEDSDRKYRDASAAAIACSGLMEMRNYVADPAKYDAVIKNILTSLATNYLSKGTESSGLLLHCAYNVNSPNPYDRDASTIWGDYYLLESLIRYKEIYQ